MKNENRLKKRKQFKWTFRNGKSVHSKNIVLIYTVTKGNGYKVGFSVTKKVGKAVVRNHTKRQMRAVVTKLQDNIISQHTIIFVAKPSIMNEKFDDISQEILSLLKMAKLYKEI